MTLFLRRRTTTVEEFEDLDADDDWDDGRFDKPASSACLACGRDKEKHQCLSSGNCAKHQTCLRFVDSWEIEALLLREEVKKLKERLPSE